MDNPLLFYSGTPLFKKIQPEHIVPAATTVFEDVERSFDRLEAHLSGGGGRKWEEIFDPLDDMEQKIHNVWGPVSHLFGVKNSADLRKCYEIVQPKLVRLGLRMSQSVVLFTAFDQMKKDLKIWNSLPRSRQRILDQRLLSARTSGVNLVGAQKERFNHISQELAQLKTKFSNNVLDSTKSWFLDISDPFEVSGLPEYLLTHASEEWTRAHEGKKSSPDHGPWRFTLDAPSYMPFMEFCKARHRREEMYRAKIAIASQGPFDNSKIIEQIIAYRAELAKLVGFDSYAAMSVASKMAGDVAAVERLLGDLLTASHNAGMTEHRELEVYAKDHGCGYSLLEWDIPFWAEKMKKEKFDYSEDELRPFFPMPRVLDGLFALVADLFGIRVEPADGQAEVWHQDVRYFNIFDDASKEYLASFYLDPYSRPETKKSGAWMDDCRGRRKTSTEVQKPVAYLVCNGTPPSGGKPSLMSFQDVLTMFHEFGHGLQHMLTEVDELGVSGISGVEWDAVELPSQFMENWLFHEESLKKISAHYETGEPLPQAYLDRIIAAKNFRAASMMLRQLQFGLVDIELHYKFDPSIEDPHRLAMRIAKKTSPLPPRPENRTLCSFSHIFAGGYSAGYYSYKWAEVLSADAFSAFEDAGLDDRAHLRQIGQKFRSTVLALGGSEHPAVVFERFRGRPVNIKALLRHNGLASDT
jgi:oligopeptidase A